MRISTSQMFDRPTSLMSQLSQRADALQTQISTSRKFTRPSDDASAYQRLDGLRRADSRDAAFGDNVDLAKGLLAQTDDTLASVETQLQRAQELALQASNGTLTPENRAQVVTTLNTVIDDLLALANTKDVRGQPLFGGTAGGAAYVRGADGAIAYAGAGEPAAIPVGEGASVQATVTGERAFGAGDSDMFAALAQLAAALSGSGDPAEATGEALEGIQASLDQVSAARTSVGARAIRLDLQSDRLEDAGIAREESRQGIEGTDTPAAITELQKTLTILQATQASFTKLSSMSLFDYLR